MTSPIDIANNALALVKSDTTIASFDELSREARLCGQFFASARDSVMSSPMVDWGFARTFVGPAELPDCGILNWNFAYRLPTDCLCLRKVIGLPMHMLHRRDSHLHEPVDDDNGIPHMMARDADGPIFLTNDPVRLIQYTARVDDPNQWIIPFVDAVTAYLASRVAVPLGGSVQIYQLCLQLYEAALSVAVSHSNTQEFQPAKEVITSFVRARR